MNFTRLVLASVLLGGFPLAAHAQVIEIDAAGEARTFDGPTLFVDVEPVAIGSTRAGGTSSNEVRARIVLEARNHGLDLALLEAVAWQESRGRINALSPKGAFGVMQLMPGTATELGVRSGDVADNIRGGALYLRRQLDRFGSVPLALAAYNAGPGAVLRYGGIPPFRETRDYVTRIMSRWRPGTSAAPNSSIIIEVSK